MCKGRLMNHDDRCERVRLYYFSTTSLYIYDELLKCVKPKKKKKILKCIFKLTLPDLILDTLHSFYCKLIFLFFFFS